MKILIVTLILLSSCAENDYTTVSTGGVVVIDCEQMQEETSESSEVCDGKEEE